MDSNQMLAVLAVVSLLPAITMAIEYVVGDDAGWAPDTNYTAWAIGKEFRVGDTLVFKYPPTAHNVIIVGREEFKACSVPAASNPLTTGKDVITLQTAGTKWYLCGKEDHCSRGQKLAVDVQPDIGFAPESPPSGLSRSSNNVAVPVYQILMIAIFLMAMVIIS